jgi:lipopolysaccharide export system protein LptA|tara:strand:+ start:406 stop:948 length:543 start_codon:yes stop_codon:yes gene_type:complete
MTLSKFLSVFCLAFSCACLSFTGDNNQTIAIESDSAERNEKTGHTQYSGNVVIHQGSLIIDANSVNVYYEDNEVTLILCNGNPASYQQESVAGSLILARAGTIEYLPKEKIINLKSDASLSTNGTLIKGERINYDIISETWRAKGGNQSDQKRIQLVIPPPKTDDANQSNPTMNEASNSR